MKPKSQRKSTSSTSVASSKKAVSKKKVVKGKSSAANASVALKKKSVSGKPMRRGSAELSAYFKTYNGGLGDFHIPVFRALKNFTSAKKLLYPGCHRHITASLIFQDIVYVDSYSKIKGVFTDEKVLEFVKEHKEYDGEPQIKFKCKNFEGDLGEKAGSFDLLMSLSAGIVSTHCAKYLKSGGYFLASDAHYDARMSFVDPQFEFTAVYDDDKQEFDSSDAAKSGHFIIKTGGYITQAMVQESIDKPKARRSFKLQKETLFYLFKKK